MSNKDLLTVVLADISNQDSPQVVTLEDIFSAASINRSYLLACNNTL